MSLFYKNIVEIINVQEVYIKFIITNENELTISLSHMKCLRQNLRKHFHKKIHSSYSYFPDWLGQIPIHILP